MELLASAQGLIPLLLTIGLAPLFAGLVNKQKAFWTGRIGAPITQPYRDLLRLTRKETIYAAASSFVSPLAPVLSLAATILAVMMLPVGFVPPLISFQGDLVAFAYLFGLARFFQILGAMDIGSSFEGMGAAREATFAVYAEPIYFFTIGSLAFASGHTSMAETYHAIRLADPSFMIFVIVSSISGFFLLVSECSRMPVDDPATHLELTMIHEVMILDNSGWDLLLYQYGAALKLTAYAIFLASFFNPFSSANVWFGLMIFTAAIVGLSAVLAWVETMVARFSLSVVPQYLLFASAIGILNLLLYIFVR
jgi:formate hydrogenlyase subunit 4